MRNSSPQPSHRSGSHFSETGYFLSYLPLLYGHRLHLLHFSGCTTNSTLGDSDLIQYLVVNLEGGTMGNLGSALQQLRAERKQAQLQVEKLDQAISVIESLNGFGTLGIINQPGRIISAASRRKMARAQRARWAKARKESQPVVARPRFL